MVTVNIQKKDLYLFGAILVFIMGAGIVIAAGSTPELNGHTFSEIQKCGDGQMLKMVGGNWACGDSGLPNCPSGNVVRSNGAGGWFCSPISVPRSVPTADIKWMSDQCISGGGGSEEMCCYLAYNSWCQGQGFGGGILTGSGGTGWCRSGGSNTHHGVCFY